MNSRVRFYNPREASPEVLEAMLVGRENFVKEVLTDLARQSQSSSRQHWLIRGPRGIGKTHLAGILYHRVRRDPGLAEKYFPVWLAETEAYSVYSAAMLLLQIAERLTEEWRDAGDIPAANALEEQLTSLTHGGDDPALFEEICEILKEEARRIDKILLVLMENLDALLAGFSGKRGAQETRRLRSLLSQDKELLFLSTTPTRYLKDLSDPKQPLYGHLRERSLQPLTEDQVGELLRRLSKITNRQEPNQTMVANRNDRVRRRVLHRLTGGNPRAIVMAFSVLSGAPGVQAIVEEMSALLDTQTAYFEARLAQLAPRERTIVMAMALAQENLTLQEIADRTRLPGRSLSTQVQRLIEQGYVAPVDGEAGKGTIYEVTDGLFRLWYQYRKGKKVLQPVVQFLAFLHSTEELERVLAEIYGTESGAAALLERELLRVTALQIEEALVFSRSPKGQAARERLWKDCSNNDELDIELSMIIKDIAESVPDEIEVKVDKLDLYLTQSNDRQSRSFVVGMSLLGRIFNIAQKFERAKETFLEIRSQLTSTSNPDLRNFLIEATLGLAEASLNLRSFPDAIDTYRSALSLIETDSNTSKDQEYKAEALAGLSASLANIDAPMEALASLRDAIELHRENPQLPASGMLAVATLSYNKVIPHLNSHPNIPALLEEIREASLHNQNVRLRWISSAFAAFIAWRSDDTDLSTIVKEIRELRPSPEETLEPGFLRLYHLLILLEVCMLKNLNRNLDAENAANWYFEFFVTKPESSPLVALGFKSLLTLLPPKAAYTWLEVLSSSGVSEWVEMARIYGCVLDVFQAAQGKPTKRGTLSAKKRRALARAPVEIRKTVEDIVDEILGSPIP